MIKRQIMALSLVAAAAAAPAGAVNERVNVSSSEVQANKFSNAPRLSADGRYVAFQSEASNLVAGDTNAAFEVFVRDRNAGNTIRVSVSSTGAQANDASFIEAMSPDGRFIVFTTRATNLFPNDTNQATDVMIRDLHASFTGAGRSRPGGAGG